MSDPAYSFQVAVAAALLGDAGVTALVGQSVYDPLSAVGKAYPLVEIGEDQVVPGDDGMTNAVWSTVHVWCSSAAGRLQAKQIGDAIRTVLAPVLAIPTLSLDGHRVISGVSHSAKYMTDTDETDPNGSVAHGVLEFRFETVPTS